MRALLTGATGFIGHRLARELRERGDEVVVLSRKPETVARSMGFSCQAFAWNPEEGEPPQEAFNEVHAVIHLAGEPIAGGRWTEEKKRRIESSRARGTANLAAAIGKLGKKPEVLVSASAIGFYGDRGDEALDESAAPGGDFLARVCENWEAPTRGLQGIRVVNPRIGLVLDPEEGALKQLLPIFQKGLGGKLGSGRQWMSWIHIDDAISALLECVSNPALKGAVNLVAPAPVTNLEFTKSLARALHRPAVFPVPGFALRIALGQISEALLGGQRVLPRKLETARFSYRFRDLDSALKDLLR